MRPELTRQFTLFEEILPVVLAGVLVNLLGPLANTEWLGIPLVFLDMAGTVMAAWLLGPWWAAMVGVLSNALNGLALTSYFPFAAVNILGGLALGYWFRGLEEAPCGWKGRLWFLLRTMMLAALLCGGLSVLVKTILYPAMGLPLHYNKPIYLLALGKLLGWGVSARADLIAVVGVDLYRDFLDKLLVVPAGLLLARLFGALGEKVASPSLHERLKTDAESILLFVVAHFLYLLFARVTVAEIRFDGALTPLYWLREGRIIALLYAPIVLAVLAFIFFTLDSNSPRGAAIEFFRARRARWYGRFGFHGLERGGLGIRHSLMGLFLLLLLWPVRGALASVGHGLPARLHLVGLGVCVLLFFWLRHGWSIRFREASHASLALHSWLESGTDGGAQGLFPVLATLFPGRIAFAGEGRGRGSFFVRAMLTERGEALCFIPEVARTLDGDMAMEIRKVLAEARVETALVLCNEPCFRDDQVVETVRQWPEIRWILLSWRDLESALEGHARQEDPYAIYVGGALRMLEERLGGKMPEKGAWAPGEAPLAELAARALANVAFLVDRLTPDSLVADFGAGRGRHSLYALMRGHRVLAVEKEAAAFRDLKQNLERTAPAVYRLEEGDYLEVKPRGLERIDLLVIAGVLQHAVDEEDLDRRLRHLREVVSFPGSRIFIEMLFDMKFDGQAKPGRVAATIPRFEEMLAVVFAPGAWKVERVAGPVYQLLDFTGGGRSFFSKASFVEQTSMEYLLTHLAGPPREAA